MKLPDYVRPGDILFERGSGFFAWAIKKLTKSQFCHTALVVDRDHVLEAWPGGVRLISNPYKEGDYEIRTCQTLNDEERQGIVDYAKHFIGTPYDYLRIFALFIEIVFHIRNRIFKRGRIICSVYTCLAYMRVAMIYLTPKIPIIHATPEDVYESPFLSSYAA